MRQIDEAREIINTLQGSKLTLTELESAQDSLYWIVGASQNEPPEGEADGSIGESDWIRLRDLEKCLREFIYQLKSVQHLGT